MDGRRLALDLSAYRQLGFYQLLNPNGPRVYGHHVYGSALKLFLLVVQLVVIFAAIGFFAGAGDDGDGTTSPFEIIIILTNCTLSSLKMYMLVRNADVVWELCEMACADFLRCSRRDAAIERDLAKRWRRATAVTNAIARSFLVGMLLWFYGPFIDRGGDDAGGTCAARRRKNIINARYPVTAEFYNEYYFAFYSAEAAVGFCIVYGSVLVDAYLMSFCWIISAQYQSVVTAYEKFGHDETEFAGEPSDLRYTVLFIYRRRCFVFRNGFDRNLRRVQIDHCRPSKRLSVSILFFQTIITMFPIEKRCTILFRKMKSFYAVVRPITLVHVFAYSCSLITYTYVIVTVM